MTDIVNSTLHSEQKSSHDTSQTNEERDPIPTARSDNSNGAESTQSDNSTGRSPPDAKPTLPTQQCIQSTDNADPPVLPDASQANLARLPGTAPPPIAPAPPPDVSTLIKLVENLALAADRRHDELSKRFSDMERENEAQYQAQQRFTYDIHERMAQAEVRMDRRMDDANNRWGEYITARLDAHDNNNNNDEDDEESNHTPSDAGINRRGDTDPPGGGLTGPPHQENQSNAPGHVAAIGTALRADKRKPKWVEHEIDFLDGLFTAATMEEVRALAEQRLKTLARGCATGQWQETSLLRAMGEQGWLTQIELADAMQRQRRPTNAGNFGGGFAPSSRSRTRAQGRRQGRGGGSGRSKQRAPPTRSGASGK